MFATDVKLYYICCNCAYGIYVEEELVGIVAYKEDDVENEFLYIYGIEIIEEKREKGIGKVVVEKIIEESKCGIKGNSLVTAISFWKKIGVKFEVSNKVLKERIKKGYSVEFKYMK